MHLDNPDDIEYNIFEKGYPKKIFYKHIVPQRIYYDPNNNIIGVHPSRIEFFKIVYSSIEEDNLKNNQN
tara:strand:+ start:460 stop:666 length:207 start_codon:yes stop_codon:yes gene_type:complete